MFFIYQNYINKIGDSRPLSRSFLKFRCKYTHLIRVKQIFYAILFWATSQPFPAFQRDRLLKTSSNMKKGTIRAIITLVGLLFLNIEAAHAGLIGRLKWYIHREFSDTQVFYCMILLLISGFLAYVIFAPVEIGKQKRTWLYYEAYRPDKQNYHLRKESIRKIGEILKTSKPIQQSH